MSWTRDILRELESNGSAVKSKRRIRQPASANAIMAEGSAPDLSCIDFGSRLMSISELAQVSGIGQKFLRKMVRKGRLRPIKVPGAQRHRYSAQQLAKIIQRENGIPGG